MKKDIHYGSVNQTAVYQHGGQADFLGVVLENATIWENGELNKPANSPDEYLHKLLLIDLENCCLQ